MVRSARRGEPARGVERSGVSVGDSIYVPAGTPHAIGEGITIVELQEPTDLSPILEYAPFPGLTREKALLGLDVETALDALDLTVLDAQRLAQLHQRPAQGARVGLLPAQADRFFRAERLTVTDPTTLDAGYRVLVVEAGSGALAWGEHTEPLKRGDTVLAPHGAGPLTLTTNEGELRVVLGMPPS